VITPGVFIQQHIKVVVSAAEANKKQSFPTWELSICRLGAEHRQK
jgi:hypothetical protein